MTQYDPKMSLWKHVSDWSKWADKEFDEAESDYAIKLGAALDYLRRNGVTITGNTDAAQGLWMLKQRTESKALNVAKNRLTRAMAFRNLMRANVELFNAGRFQDIKLPCLPVVRMVPIYQPVLVPCFQLVR